MNQHEIRLRPPRLSELSTWTIPWREAWGWRANEIEDAGVPWPDHEVQAFDEMKSLKDKGGKPPAGKPPKRAGTAKGDRPAKAKPAETTGKLNLGKT